MPQFTHMEDVWWSKLLMEPYIRWASFHWSGWVIILGCHPNLLLHKDIVNIELHINTSAVINLPHPTLRFFQSRIIKPPFVILWSQVLHQIYPCVHFFDLLNPNPHFILNFISNFISRVHFRDPINSVSIYPAASQVNGQLLIQ